MKIPIFNYLFVCLFYFLTLKKAGFMKNLKKRIETLKNINDVFYCSVIKKKDTLKQSKIIVQNVGFNTFKLKLLPLSFYNLVFNCKTKKNFNEIILNKIEEIEEEINELYLEFLTLETIKKSTDQEQLKERLKKSTDTNLNPFALKAINENERKENFFLVCNVKNVFKKIIAFLKK